MPTACTVKTPEAFRSVLAEHELLRSQVGLYGIFDVSGSLVIGVFATSFIYNRIVPLAPETQLLQLTLIVFSVCLPLLWAIGRLSASSLAYAAWRDNENWCRMMFQVAKATKATCFFLCSHFVYGLVIGFFIQSRCSLLECLALLPAAVVTFQLFHCLLKGS